MTNLQDILEKQSKDSAKEVFFVDVLESIEKNAVSISETTSMILEDYREIDVDAYRERVGVIHGHLERLTSLLDNDLPGTFQEMNEVGNI